MKTYYYYVLIKIYFKKGVKKMKKFCKWFAIGFIIGLIGVAWVSTTIKNCQAMQEYVYDREC